MTPTVNDVLSRTAIGCGWHLFPGVGQIHTTELRAALEDAYDPTMPDWPAMVELGNYELTA